MLLKKEYINVFIGCRNAVSVYWHQDRVNIGGADSELQHHFYGTAVTGRLWVKGEE